jgi:Bacterial transcriptional activator domain
MLRKIVTVIILLTLLIDLGSWGSSSVLAAEAEAGGHTANVCTAEQGQIYIDAGQYEDAIDEFTCLIEAHPTEVEGYRGRIEAEVLLGRYSDAVRDYQRLFAFVLPVHPDARDTIKDGYAARLAVAPDDIRALTGASFARWWFFDYSAAMMSTAISSAVRAAFCSAQPRPKARPIWSARSRSPHKAPTCALSLLTPIRMDSPTSSAHSRRRRWRWRGGSILHASTPSSPPRISRSETFRPRPLRYCVTSSS